MFSSLALRDLLVGTSYFSKPELTSKGLQLSVNFCKIVSKFLQKGVKSLLLKSSVYRKFPWGFCSLLLKTVADQFIVLRPIMHEQYT